MKKPEPRDFGISQEDISLETENQEKRNAQPGCGARLMGYGLCIMSTFLFALFMGTLHIPTILLNLFALVWLVGSFILIYLLLDWCYDALWRKKVPAPNPSIHEYYDALAKYSYWLQNEERKLQNEERKAREYWFGLSGHRFEEEFGMILRNNGYSISVTKGSADGGVDIVAQKGRVKKIIQCKAHKNPIGPGPIRELFGVLSSGDFKAKSAIVVCLGGFTRGAREFADNTDIELWDIDDVLKLAKQTDDKKLGS
jgi:hypothetical protein